MQKLTTTTLTKKQSYWQAHIRKANVSGQSYSTYAKANDLEVQHLYQYQHVLRKKSKCTHKHQTPGFNKLTVTQHNPVETNQLKLTFPNGMRLAFSSSLDPRYISEVIAHIGSSHVTP